MGGTTHNRGGIRAKFVPLVFLPLLFVLLTACSDGLPKEFPAPDFSLRDLATGEEIRLSAYKGRPVLLYFFASW